MQQALLILPVVVPIVFWAAYHYHKDRHLPEPLLNLLLCFGLGLLSAGLSKLSLKSDATHQAALTTIKPSRTPMRRFLGRTPRATGSP